MKAVKKQWKNAEQNRTPVPVFFAADENYMPFLGVTLTTLIAYADNARQYNIHVLYAGKLGKNAENILRMQTENVRIQFHDVTRGIEKIQDAIHCRDYYTGAIYFRLFIPELFPQYAKAVYLDCDIVLRTDVAKLYDIPLGDNYIGAVPDPIVATTPAFSQYTKRALGIEGEKYFNSGVIVMQTDKLRSIDFCYLFARVLRSYDFVVAPDQDCLNLICKDKVHYFGREWNTMPLAEKRLYSPKLIHYNLSMKPWHYDDVLYAEYFWEAAKETPFFKEILAKKNAFSAMDKRRDEEAGVRLLALALAEANNPRNYENTVGKRLRDYQKKGNIGGMYGFIEYFVGKKNAVKTD